MLFGSHPLAFLPAEDHGRADLRRALASLPQFPTVDRPAALARDWNRDPETGRAFPLVHWSRLDYREPEIEGGVRRLWYAARHLDVPDLALAYYLNPDPQTAALALIPITTWIDQCPPGRGIHWTVPLEMALRLIGWGYAIRLLAGAPALAAAAPRIAAAVDAQAEHILTYRSRFSSANNHLIAQAAGLLHGGFAFCGRPRAARWREAGAAILWTEIERQTTADGVSRELSLHYQELVLELGLLSWLLLRANGTEPPAAAKSRLAAMLEFVAELDRFPGGAPDFGDSDGQSALPFQGAHPSRASLLAIGAALLDRPDWAPAHTLTRPAAVLLGAAGRERFNALGAPRPTLRSRFYPEAGLALFRDASGDRALLFDCGPLGFLATAAHGHADCLALALGAFGEPLLIDPGTFTYHAEPRFRDHFRGTAAHTTLRVDGEEQSEMRGAFLWGRRAEARVDRVATGGAWDVITASHDGYERLSSPVRHRRSVIFVKPDYFWITDELLGMDEHLAECFWHFAPGSTLIADDGWIRSRAPGGTELHLRWVGPDARPPLELWEGAEQPIQGWSSPRFGVRVPAPVLRLAAVRQLPWRTSVLLRPLAPAPERSRSAAEPVLAGAAALGAGEVLWARGMPGEDLLLRDDAAGELELAQRESLSLGGRLALLRRQDGQVTAIAGIDLTHLRAGADELVTTEGERVDFSVQRLGDQAVVEGWGGRLGLAIPGVREVRGPQGPLASERRGGRLWIDLGERRAGGGGGGGGVL
jgi:Heparinase II/III-like protein/Heparinase II/III N-terminus